MSDINWSELSDRRHEIAGIYKSIWSVPIRRRYSDVLLGDVSAPKSVLDLGAGARRVKIKVEKKWPGIIYKSFDIDTSQNHDFTSLDQIEGEFDLVCNGINSDYDANTLIPYPGTIHAQTTGLATQRPRSRRRCVLGAGHLFHLGSYLRRRL